MLHIIQFILKPYSTRNMKKKLIFCHSFNIYEAGLILIYYKDSFLRKLPIERELGLRFPFNPQNHKTIKIRATML